MEMAQLNMEAANSGWNMNPVDNGSKIIGQGATGNQEEVEGSEWDASDPNKKKVKKARRYSFD